MTKLRTSSALLLIFTVFIFCATSQISAEGSEVLPWGVGRIRANLVWDYNGDMVVDEGANAGQYVSIAVIDTGVYYWTESETIHYHEDLEGNVLGGKGFRHWMCHVEENDNYEDIKGHGTHVSGTIAAVDNTIGVIGTAPKTKIYALRLYTQDPAEVANATRWAVHPYHYAQIISMSLGYDYDDPELREACDYAYAQGALLIASAGNDGKADDIDYPAKYTSVIAVGAVDQSDPIPQRASFSDMGPELELVAPGVNVYSTWLDDGYRNNSGTSMAVPHVTGVAALIWSSKIDPEYDENGNGAWDNSEVRDKLKDTALDLGDPGKDDSYGYGLVNAWYSNQRPPGDIAGSTADPSIPPDGRVNYKDLYVMLQAYGSKPEDPHWDIRADIIIDNHVNYEDLYIMQVHYGEIDP